jgi:arylsulfatase A-like enzyme
MMPKRPNILLITTDTQRWDTLRCMAAAGRLPEGERRGFALWNDLTTTILAAAGVSGPAVQHMQGYDLYTPLCRGEGSPRQHAAATLLKTAAVATQRWKLSYYFEDGRGQLFDRTADPQEQIDLYDDPDQREVRDQLLFGLLAWYGDTIDLHGLIARSHRGGPIARRAVAHMKGVSGLQAKERLNQICRAVDRVG